MRSERPASQPVSYRKRALCLFFQNMVSLKIEQNDCEKRILPTKREFDEGNFNRRAKEAYELESMLIGAFAEDQTIIFKWKKED